MRAISCIRAFTIELVSIEISNNVHEASNTQSRNNTKEEIKASEKNGTWEVTTYQKNKKTVGCKWIFTIKHEANDNIEIYKARLVARGFTQSYGIDYQEIFTPVQNSTNQNSTFNCC